MIFVDASAETSEFLVPSSLRETALLTAHNSVMSGHTGVAPTTKKLSQFFWPGVTRDVRMYCQTCDACERTVDKGRIPSAPLQQMPLTGELFMCVAIGLVGQFDPISERGHRDILTIVNVATRFPEAVFFFKRIDIPAIAETPLSVFQSGLSNRDLIRSWRSVHI